MSSRAKVQLYGQNRFAYIDTDATNGAVIGENVWNADGSLFSPPVAATPSAEGVSVTLWSLVQSIPANVQGIAALTGDGVVRKSGGSFSADPLSGAIGCIFDGGGSALTAGAQCDVPVPFDCTITKATILADVSGDIVIDVWADGYATFPPTVADTITAAAPPTITASAKSQDTTLTGWTTAITAGTILRFNINSCATITRATIELEVQK